MEVEKVLENINNNCKTLGIFSNEADGDTFKKRTIEASKVYNKQLINEIECLTANLTQILELLRGKCSIENNETTSGANFSRNKTNDAGLVQIIANNTEIERRIHAFIVKKRSEINERNKRDFGHMFPSENGEGCARVDAIFTCENGSRSRVYVKRVVNQYGPQTKPHLIAIESRRHVTTPTPSMNPTLIYQSKETDFASDGKNKDLLNSVQERLSSMEQHARLSQFDGGRKKTLFERLRDLEDRILQLESISPEYFDSLPLPHKKKKISHGPVQTKNNMNVKQETTNSDDIDAKIMELKRKLLEKKIKLGYQQIEYFAKNS